MGWEVSKGTGGLQRDERSAKRLEISKETGGFQRDWRSAQNREISKETVGLQIDGRFGFRMMEDDSLTGGTILDACFL